MYIIEIKVETYEEALEINKVIEEAEDEGELDFPFSYHIYNDKDEE